MLTKFLLSIALASIFLPSIHSGVVNVTNTASTPLNVERHEDKYSHREESNKFEKGEPDYRQYAQVARYIIHKSDYTSLGTISTLDDIKGYPMVNIMSVADSARGKNSTGDIYLYLLNVDYTTHDLKAQNKLTALFSNNQDLSCTNRGVDPMEPTCSRIMITGSVAQLVDDSAEYNFAAKAFLSRHPSSPKWIKRHNSLLCKIEIKQIAVLDYYGGQHYVTVDDYYNANIDELGH